ncbi:MAG: glycoside hydrolase family 3 protein [Gemmatimonadetes bacterium]|nr:glycoside hydrolase family 3 protein [Gemmatimonadota bacterium]
MRPARLLFPDLRAGPDGGFESQEDRIRSCLRLGVGGFILFGGRAEKVRELTERLRAQSPHPILIGADLERGAGQQFRGLTQLPPLAALGWLDDLVAIHEAGRITAAEARSVGVDWVYAPVADIAVEPNNPIVGTRAFGAHPITVARQVAAWVIGCEAGGALSCAKHFPGHGRTTTDSHLVLPTVGAKLRHLKADLIPFAAAVEAGVPTVMSAHVAYPALDRSGAPATLSRRILTRLLRRRLGFDGLVVSDAMNMGGVVEAAGSGGAAAVAALMAGVDALLHPQDPEALAAELEDAGRTLSPRRIAAALDRVEHATAHAAQLTPGDTSGAAEWAARLARRVTFPMRGLTAPLAGTRVRLRTVDDDLGGPYSPPARDVFPTALGRAGVELVDGDGGRDGVRTVLAVYCEPRAWKGRPGLSMDSQRAVRQALDEDPAALVVLFAHPRLAEGLPSSVAALEAWGGEAVMQEAAASRLGSGARD